MQFYLGYLVYTICILYIANLILLSLKRFVILVFFKKKSQFNNGTDYNITMKKL